MIEYDFEQERVKRFLRRHRAKRAGIQLPAGLRPFWPEIARTVRGGGAEPVFLGTCYGACDLADEQAKRLRCQVLLHYGHADMGLQTVIPTMYIEARVKTIVLSALEQLANRVHGRRIGIFTTAQYVGHLRSITKKLRGLGLIPVLGRPGPRAKYRGQVLGCDLGCVRCIANKCDALLYVGTGRFHALGAALAARRPTYIANPISGGLGRVGGLGEFIRSRKAVVSKAAGARKFGVVTSTKRGQMRRDAALEVIRKLRASGRSAELVVLDEISPEGLGDYSFDALVCVACPRIPIDDAPRYEVPVLSAFEVDVMLGEALIENYQIDQIGP
jgi:2-(3-amino-3-carboxypropyl)histidine synthase